ncbi:diguanylate cyclase (plasmid) [Deinococcus sp. KNUC1210]|uniref:diguanylate cyclase domain-containing protein n=1 Tax=Deinococcus sp. KNUC1210 TaxID=2917691 RepID=UPI001EEFDE7E|nr:diguanylate cyclase [Deinococcus sp. KNUC1210]ULH17712.1 diguanylate cyclase [Deinococcus sp. KNUC1210]
MKGAALATAPTQLSGTRTSLRLRRAYLSTLIVLALLSIASNLLMSIQVQATRSTATLVNTAGRQRMLAVRISSDAENAATTHDPNSTADLRQSLEVFETNHLRLADPASGLYTSGYEPDVKTYYTRILDPLVVGFTAAAHRVLATPLADLRPSRPDVAFLAEQARGPLLSALDHAVTLDTHRSDVVIARVEALSWVRVSLVLSLLAALGIFVFRPLERRNRVLLADLIQERNAVQAQAHQLTQLAREANLGRQDAVVLAELTRGLGEAKQLSDITGTTHALLSPLLGSTWLALLHLGEAAQPSLLSLHGPGPATMRPLLERRASLSTETLLHTASRGPDYVSDSRTTGLLPLGVGALAMVPLPDKPARGPVLLLAARTADAPQGWSTSQRRLLEAAARATCDAWERVALLDELRRSADYSQALLQVSALSDTPRSPEDVAHEAAIIITQVTDLDWAGLVVLRQGTGRVLTAYQHPDLPSTTLARLTRDFTDEEGLIWEVAQRGQPQFVDDYAQQLHARPELIEAGIHAATWVPLGTFEDTHYLLIATRLNDQPWAAANRELLAAAARTVSLALTRASYLHALEAAALLDPLTSLPNRRAFQRDLDALLSQADRHRQAFAVVMIDMDGLKTVNDRDGHEAGDALLGAFADSLKLHFRVEDQVYRLGGDEYALLLPQTGAQAQDEIRRRVQRAVAHTQQRGFLHAAASSGVAFAAQDGWHAQTLVSLADERMYQEKAQHRTTRLLSS